MLGELPNQAANCRMRPRQVLEAQGRLQAAIELRQKPSKEGKSQESAAKIVEHHHQCSYDRALKRRRNLDLLRPDGTGQRYSIRPYPPRIIFEVRKMLRKKAELL